MRTFAEAQCRDLRNRRTVLDIEICILTVTDGGDVDDASGVVNAVDDAVIADPYPPEIFPALELDRGSRARNGHQGFDMLDDSFRDGQRSPNSQQRFPASFRGRLTKSRLSLGSLARDSARRVSKTSSNSLPCLRRSITAAVFLPRELIINVIPLMAETIANSRSETSEIFGVPC